jgi:hypothetical protein
LAVAFRSRLDNKGIKCFSSGVTPNFNDEGIIRHVQITEKENAYASTTIWEYLIKFTIVLFS